MIKTLLLFIIAFGFFLGMTTGQETTLTLMSYNIYHGEHHYENGKSNLREVAQLIKKINPDFVALQEVDSMTQRTAELNDQIPVDLVQELADMTGMHGYFAKAIDFSNGGYGEGLLSKFPAEMSQIQLPSPQGGEGRSMAMATYKLDNGQKITFGATHLCHEFDKNRLAQVDAIIHQLAQMDHPTVIAGDLNFSPDDVPYPVLAKYFTDAAAAYGNPQPTIPFNAPQSRIDYIWLTKGHHWEITDVQVIPIGLSDHMPLIVTVVLKP